MVRVRARRLGLMAVLGLAAWSANHFAIEAFNENGVSRPSDVARAP